MTVNDARVRALHRRARKSRCRIVLPDGNQPAMIEAAGRAAGLGLAEVTLLGDPDGVRGVARGLSIDLAGVAVRSLPADGPEAAAALRAYRERSAARGLTEDEAREHLQDGVLRAALDVAGRRYDALVTGGPGPQARTLEAVLRGVPMLGGVRRASSFALALLPRDDVGSRGRLVLADPALQAEPSSLDLAETALLAGRGAAGLLGEPARVALLSFSTHGSARHPRAERVAEAARILAARAPDLVADGEIQLDAALVPGVAAKKAPASPLRGRANVLVFPDLGSADVGIRVLAALGGARVLGPFLQGLERPVGVLGQAPAVDDVVDALALVATLCVGSSPEGDR